MTRLVLHTHRAERTDALVAALGELLADPTALGSDPFAAEVVAVPTRGVERWLSQRLSHRLGSSAGDGVCAGVAFPSPARLVVEAVSAAGGHHPDESPWAPARLQWDALAVLDDVVAAQRPAADPDLAVVAGYLGRAASSWAHGRHLSHRRLVTAQAVARLLDGYAAQRPAMLRAWSVGGDDDGSGEPLPADLRWQPTVWRRVRARVLDRTGVPPPAEVLPAVVDLLVADPGVVELPARLSVFGPTRLTTAELDVLAALAAHRDVHLWLPHPSPALWAAVRERLAVSPAPSRLRADDSTAELGRLPLLDSLGRDARELQVRLAALPVATPRTDEHHSPSRPLLAPCPQTLLGRLQDALAGDAPPPPLPLAADDHSVRLHACHGLPRQVEVLRELLVGLLADDPTLEPRDVVVMCPDVERAAPLVAAAFGRSASADQPLGHPGQRIRVKVADRSLLQVNPLLSLLGHLLDLAGARCTLDEVVGVVAQPPVRRRFALRDDDLEQLGRWLPQVGVRWGIDVEHRARHGLPGVPENTWQAGLDRLLLGVAMTEDGLPLVGGVLPHDDVASQRAELAGRLAEIVERLGLVLGALRDPQPLEAWAAALAHGLDLLADVGPGDEWQDAAARRVLAEVVDEAGAAAATAVLCLADVRVLLADRLAGRPTRASFRTGDLTVCSLAPMRSVPHRVVVLLGLDDEAFPRTGGVRGDDVLVRRPFVGDRDPRSEDRQILLDAVHAATERLLVLYTGMNPRTNAAEPPAVPIGELLDTLRRMVEPADRDRLVVRHTLQPFDERNLVLTGDNRPDVSARPRPFCYDPAMLAAAEAARAGRRPAVAIRDLRLPPAPPEPEIRLDDLVAMLERPAKAFLRQRLGMRPPDEDRPPPQRIPLSLDNLERWAVGDRLLEQIRQGRETAAARAEIARSLVPYGRLGSELLAEVLTEAQPIAAAAPARSVALPVQATLPDGRIVTGRLADVAAGTLVTVTYSKIGARQRLRAWVPLVLAAAADDDGSGSRPWQSLLVGRGDAGAPPTVERRGPLDPATARQLLVDLVALRDVGLTRVLPAALQASHAYASTAQGRTTSSAVRSATNRAQSAWGGRFGDRADAVNASVWGPDAPLDRLLDVPAPGPLAGGEPHWFAELAHRIWLPLLRQAAAQAGP